MHELTRTDRIPHRRLAGTRRCLFRADELLSWLDGAALEVRQLHGAGKLVRPVPPTTFSRRTPASEMPATEGDSFAVGDCESPALKTKEEDDATRTD